MLNVTWELKTKMRVEAFDNSMEQLNMMTLFQCDRTLGYDGTIWYGGIFVYDNTFKYDGTPRIWWNYLKWSIWQETWVSEEVSCAECASQWHLLSHHGTWCANSGTGCIIIWMDGINAMFLKFEGFRNPYMADCDWLTPSWEYRLMGLAY